MYVHTYCIHVAVLTLRYICLDYVSLFNGTRLICVDYVFSTRPLF